MNDGGPPALRGLIVGGAGFVGDHLVRHCLDMGDEVHVLARGGSDVARLGDIAGRITLHRVDLNDPAALGRCLEAVRADWICHLGVKVRIAARDDLGDLSESVEANLTPLLNLVAAVAATSRPPARFVRVGSLAEYGPGAHPHDERERENTADAYAASLAACAHYLQAAAGRLACRAVTARPGLVYGPGQSDAFLVPALIRACLAGRPTTIRRPQARRDMVHVDDVVRGLRRLATAAEIPSIVNLASGKASSVAQIAETIRALTDASSDLVLFEAGEDVGADDCQLGSPALASAMLGWTAQLGLEDGLRGLVEAERATARPSGA